AEPGVLCPAVSCEVGVHEGAGAHQAGDDGGDLDSVLCEFGVQPLGEADGGELGTAVRDQMGHADFAADGGYVGDPAAAAGQHVREHSQGGIDGAPEHHVHGFLVVGRPLVLERPDRDGAGIVDQHVDAAEVVNDFADHAVHVVVAGYIANHR